MSILITPPKASSVMPLIRLIPKYNTKDIKGNVHFFIDSSSIPKAGEGCFARHHFKENELLSEYLGTYHKKVNDTMYVFTLKVDAPYRHLDAKNVTINNPMRYVNGANHFIPGQLARVNVKAKEVEGRIFYYATRDIEAGEELIIDYGARYWTDKSHHSFN